MTDHQSPMPLDARPFEILPEHRDRPGWDWLVERLTRPTPAETAATQANAPESERVA
jgi:hypothetical protein